ncbi:MAG TPA: lamin tail domain-containing protein [Acidimicrobiia bacterium]
MLRLRVMWHADGLDAQNARGEWVEVINDGGGSVDLENWELRDANSHRFVFPDITIDQGDSVRVVAGHGTPHGTLYYWNNSDPLFLDEGDEAVLLDPAGDIRAYFEFPCLSHCADPLTDQIARSVMYHPPSGDIPNTEWVDTRNVSNQTIDLYDHFLSNDGDTYLFDEPTPVPPGASTRVRVGRRTDSTLERHWGKSDTILQNRGDRVELLGLDGRRVACFAWGNETCRQRG